MLNLVMMAVTVIMIIILAVSTYLGWTEAKGQKHMILLRWLGTVGGIATAASLALLVWELATGPGDEVYGNPGVVQQLLTSLPFICTGLCLVLWAYKGFLAFRRVSSHA